MMNREVLVNGKSTERKTSSEAVKIYTQHQLSRKPTSDVSVCVVIIWSAGFNLTNSVTERINPTIRQCYVINRISSHLSQMYYQ